MEKNAVVDLRTKRAWEKNWENVDVEDILQIFNYERVREQMAIFLRVLPKHEKILEGGCWLCPYLIKLKSLGYDVEGIDYNEAPVKEVLRYDPSLHVKVGDVRSIPYPDGTFGGYLSLGVIEHFTDGPREAIREAWRVLKPGGVFVVAVPRLHLFMRLQAPIRFLKGLRFLRRFFRKPDHHYWEHYFAKRELGSILESEGFEVREIHPLDHSHALCSSFGFLRDRTKYDEATELGIRLGRWARRHLPWMTAAQMTFVSYKR